MHSIFRKRKALLAAACAATVLPMIAYGGTSSAYASPRNGGTDVTLNVLLLQGSAANVLTAMVPQFEHQYGIKVNVTSAPYNAMHQKEVEDFISHTDRYDVVQSDNPWLEEYAPAGWELDLAPYLKQLGFPVTRLPGGRLKLDDMISNVLNDYGNYQGKLYTVPWLPGAQMLYYRKDLFQSPSNQAAFKKQFGYPLTVPHTLQQLYDVAKFFTNPAKGMYGLAWSAGSGNEAENDWEEILWAMGGDVFPFGQGFPSKKNALLDMPIVDNPISKAALEYFDGLKPFMPPGAGQWVWANITPPYTTGHAAMMIEWSDFVSSVASSKYRHDTGYAMLPGDPAAPAYNLPNITPGEGYSSLGGWAAAVNADTKQPLDAVKFLLWASGLTMTSSQRLHYENAAFTGFGFPSSYTNPQTLGYKLHRFPTELKEYEHNVRRRPEVSSGLEVQTIIGNNASEAFNGQESVTLALANMQSQLFAAMKSLGYIPTSTGYTWPGKYVTKAGLPVR